jgi:hypothetical protein
MRLTAILLTLAAVVLAMPEAAPSPQLGKLGKGKGKGKFGGKMGGGGKGKFGKMGGGKGKFGKMGGGDAAEEPPADAPSE